MEVVVVFSLLWLLHPLVLTSAEHMGSYEFSKSGFLMENKYLCRKSDPDIFIWIHTAPGNLRRRLALRMTWGNRNPNLELLNQKTAVGFFVGAAQNYTEQTVLTYEQQMYGDIIQGDYIDHYHNLTYKAVQAVCWITKNCNRTKLVIKADDDALIDVPKLLRQIRSMGLSHVQDLRNTIGCKVYRKATPIRKKKHKWYVSSDYYSPQVYPPFCQGLFVVISPDLIPKMYRAARQLPLLWMDDVSLFGIVVKDVAARLVSLGHPGPYRYDIKSVIEMIRQGAEPAYHTAELDHMFYLWSAILRYEQQTIQ